MNRVGDIFVSSYASVSARVLAGDYKLAEQKVRNDNEPAIPKYP
jgi:hypothetical protein